MSNGSRRVSRTRSGAKHLSTLATRWTVRVTGIEFINDYPMEAPGRNRSDTDPDRKHYATIPEDFRGWGRGMPLTGWDWEGTDDLERAACYRRQRPVAMRVRLRSSVPAPSARNFTLEVTPALDGDTTVLTAATAAVSWPAGQQERIVNITTGGALPDEVSRYHLRLTWSVSGLTPGGVITRSGHKIFSFFEDPLDPSPSGASGTALGPVIGLTKQRLDKLTLITGGSSRRFPRHVSGHPTPALSATEIDRLIWLVHVAANDETPPYFEGRRAVPIRYGSAGPTIDLIDQWVMWLGSRTWSRANEHPHWNAGSCIGHAQLMKTMLASVGINSRRSWVLPKTTLMPDGSTVSLSATDVIAFDNLNLSANQQSWTFTVGGLTYDAAVRLIDKPSGPGSITWEYFEACLFYSGKLVPGAIPTSRYPAAVRSAKVGFPDGMAVLRWWHSVNHGSFHRFMAWVSESPAGYFDRDGTFYGSPYDIPVGKRLPLP